jgi:hypothetical protein
MNIEARIQHTGICKPVKFKTALGTVTSEMRSLVTAKQKATTTTKPA